MDANVQTQKNYPYGGGFMGFIRGTQSLAAAFWGVGVMPALILFFAAMATAGSDHFLVYIIAVSVVTIIVRIFAWYSIIKCRKNTSNEAYTILALVIVGLDMAHKLLIWTVFFAISIPKLLSYT